MTMPTLRLSYCALTISLLVASGCTTLAPDYLKPDAADAGVPQKWAASLPDGAQRLELTRWWSQFGSPAMAGLVDTALATSPSMDTALQRVVQARIGTGSSIAALMPKVGATGVFTRSRTKDKTSLNGTRIDYGTDVDPATGMSIPTETVTQGRQDTFERSFMNTRGISYDMSWELDLFGGRRSSINSSRALLEARQADWRGARVTLAAEVASVYAQRRHCEALLAVAEADLVSRNETHRLTLQRRDAGFIIPADADRTDASVAEAGSTLTALQADCASYQNQLVALTGLSYEEVGKRLETGPADLPSLPAGSLALVPAEAITQRPDVAAAERQLAAANANIGVARAAALPSITLIGSIGINVGRGTKNDVTSQNGSDVQSNSGRYSLTSRPWSFGPSISLPIFDGGKAAADIELSKSVFQEASAIYQSTVRNAVLEVENALVRVDSAGRRLSDIERARKGYMSFFNATEAQYREGATSLLALEDARRVLLASRQALLGERLVQLQAWITLFKAVGGGWQSEEPPAGPEFFNPVPITASLIK